MSPLGPCVGDQNPVAWGAPHIRSCPPLRDRSVGRTYVREEQALTLADIRSVSDDPATFLPSDPLLHLLRRATFGPSPSAIARIRTIGAATWLDEQLSPASIADPVCDD